jgi:hydroxymethylbilane synthase
VAALLRRHHPRTEVTLVEMTTAGDRFLHAPLAEIGGKGLFIKEIEQAILDGRARLAVHSLKDMTSALPEPLCLAAIPEREDPRDAFVSSPGAKLSDLPHGAAVGTSSLRRQCQLLERRPDLRIVSLRGNVQTRLRKMREQNLAGVVLAVAGLRRLNLDAQISEVLDLDTSLPAVGQGALAIECRSDDRELISMLAPLEDAQTRIAVRAERAFLARLEGGCTVPLAAHAMLSQSVVRLRGLIGRPDGTRVVRGERSGQADDAEAIGVGLAEELLSRGGGEILASFGRAAAMVPES